MGRAPRHQSSKRSQNDHFPKLERQGPRFGSHAATFRTVRSSEYTRSLIRHNLVLSAIEKPVPIAQLYISACLEMVQTPGRIGEAPREPCFSDRNACTKDVRASL